MGARRRGDIKILCDVVRPQYAIITGVTGQHLETFKTLDNVYAEKFSVLNYIPEDGFCIVNRRGIEREIDLPKNAFFVGGTGDFAYADEIKINSNGSNFCLYLDGKNTRRKQDFLVVITWTISSLRRRWQKTWR